LKASRANSSANARPNIAQPALSIALLNSLLQQSQANQSQLQHQRQQQQQQQQQQHHQQQQLNLAAAAGGNMDNASLINAAILAHQMLNQGQHLQSMGDNGIKEKINALLEQNKREEEKRRKLEVEFQLKVRERERRQ
jgi:hypothetical protein